MQMISLAPISGDTLAETRIQRWVQQCHQARTTLSSGITH